MAQSPQRATTADINAPERKKILVVGATGFLGAKILYHLAADKSAAVVAMSRKGPPRSWGCLHRMGSRRYDGPDVAGPRLAGR